MPRRVWVVSELYHPEETSTGYLLTRIAEGLAREFPVFVLCGQPTYSARGVRAPRREERNGVSIRRCPGTTLDKDVLAFRLVNALTLAVSIFFAALRSFRRGEPVLVVTNPPLLPFVVALAAAVRGSPCALIIHDVYPEALVSAGLLGRDGLVARALAGLSRWLYRRMRRIVVLGRDMHALVQHKLGGTDGRVVLIPNWADLDLVRPEARDGNPLLGELGLRERFVVQYAGNMGRTHGAETLVDAARRLRHETPDVCFLFIGSGARRAWIEDTADREGLDNVRVLPSRPRSDQPTFLNASDVAIISFAPGMAGVSVPSRMYNVLAAGKPIIAVADEESELARVVREADVGWVVRPGDAEGVARAVLEAHGDRGRLHEMGRRAERAAATRFSLSSAVDAYCGLVHSMKNGG
jgi:glycosyltransferase involved in cell wall biosynthesis